MKQSRYFSRWKPRYFRLEDGFLTYYDKKSLVGTHHKNKVRPRMAEHGFSRWYRYAVNGGVGCVYIFFVLALCLFLL